MKADSLKALLWLGALVLLGWIYQQSRQVDPAQHLRTVTYLEQLRQHDARLNQFVLQARFGLLRNYDPLVATQGHIQNLLLTLEQDKPEYFGPGQAPVNQRFLTYQELLKTKFAKLEAFKSHNAVLHNSIHYLPTAVQQILQTPGSDHRSHLLHDLLESVLMMQGANLVAQQEHIKLVMHQLGANERQPNHDLTSLKKHVNIILEFQGEVDTLTRDITQSATANASNQLFELYGELYATRQRVADSYRIALAGLSVFFLAYLAWMLTALRRARQTLMDSVHELEFQKFALDTHSIVSIADRTGKITYTNDKFSEISQYSREELLGQDHRMLNSGHHSPDFFKSMWSTIGSGKVWHGEVKNKKKDGTFYWVDSTIVPSLGADGNVLRYVSIRTDITQRKTADEQLATQRLFYERITETLGEGLYVQDAMGRCLYLNKEGERLLGWSRDEFIGKPVHDTIHTHSATGQPIPSADCPILQNVLQNGETQLDDQVFVRKDKSVFPVAVSSKASYSSEGQVETIVVAFSDITERKRTEQALLAAKYSAEEAARVKSDFLANMSHEIRTPMNGIIGMTNLTMETDLNPEQREYVGLIKSSADALLDVINDILDFSKIESGKMTLEHIEFSLESMLHETTKALSIRAHQKGLELMLHLEPNVPNRVIGDPGRIRQIIINLVGNAIKFTDHGEIEVSVHGLDGAAPNHSRLRFAVRDTGIGIAADKFKAIFDSFAQADTSTTRKYGGTGLGLTISSQLVALMGSHIELESDVGQGSNFWFSLDLPTPSNQALAHYQKSGRIADLTVLVVDDNHTNRRVLEEMLRNWRMRPTSVASGAEALSELTRAAASGSPYPLVLLDVQMPGMDGFELVEHMRGLPVSAAATVMMLTSQGQRGDAERCRSLAVASYLSKPIAPSALLNAIMTALGEPLQESPPLITQHYLRETGRKLKLLLAEDNLANQKLATTLLQRQGHQVTVANNGLEAVAHWQQGGFDAILMDVDMPEMNGYQATQHIREIEQQNGQHIPIVAMTAHAMQGAREVCLSHGMDGYVSKPMELDTLLLELNRFVPTRPSASDAVADLAPVAHVSMGEPSPVVDFAKLRQGIDNNRELFDELVQLYRTDAPMKLAALREGLAQADSDKVRHAAHALKGMVGIFAAERTLAAAQAVEMLAGRSDCTDAIAHLEQALLDFDAALDSYQW